MKAAPAAFQFKAFSVKQKKLLTWWTDPSPYRDYDMVVADGSIRSGKTVSMIISFLQWSMARHTNQNFIIAGKSMGTLKRNVLQPMFQILAALGIPYRYHRSEHYVEIGSNTYYCFGANNEASQDVLQGLTAAGGLADEVALFPQSFVEQMIARCSVEGSKLFLNCNPEGPYHFVKTELIDKAKEKRILHLHFTMDDNLTLSTKRKDFYKRFYQGLFYQRMVLGLWTLAEGVIYDNFDASTHVISRAEFARRFGSQTIPEGWKRIRSIDFGYTHAFVCQWWAISPDGEWFLYREIYRTKRLVEDHAKRIIELSKGERFLATVADHDAEDRATLERHGVKTQRAIKDVTPGIQECHQLLTVNPETGRPRLYILDDALVERDSELAEAGLPIRTAQEFATYVWTPLEKSKGEDMPIKEKDHGCFVAGTVVTTLEGPKAIEAIRVGDMVLTRRGYRQVLDCGMTDPEAGVLTAEFTNGQVLTGTGNHPVFVVGKGFVRLDTLRDGDEVIWWQANPFASTESSSGDTLTRNSGPIACTSPLASETGCGAVGASTKKSGRPLAVRFWRGMKSITKTAIRLTTQWTTWSAFRSASTPIDIVKSGAAGNELPNICNTWTQFVRWLQYGTELKRGVCGTESTPKSDGTPAPSQITTVSTAVPHSNPRPLADMNDSVPQPAKRRTDERPEWTTSNEPANGAGDHLLLTGTQRPEHVPVRVVRVCAIAEQRPVFNLAVDGEHEYYANGVLVHNCDAMRYAIYTYTVRFSGKLTPITLNLEVGKRQSPWKM